MLPKEIFLPDPESIPDTLLVVCVIQHVFALNKGAMFAFNR
jgi:hypothetical protein